jgi:hypothetical protein
MNVPLTFVINYLMSQRRGPFLVLRSLVPTAVVCYMCACARSEVSPVHKAPVGGAVGTAWNTANRCVSVVCMICLPPHEAP